MELPSLKLLTGRLTPPKPAGNSGAEESRIHRQLRRGTTKVPEMLRKESRAAVPVALYVRALAGDPDNSLPVQFYALEHTP